MAQLYIDNSVFTRICESYEFAKGFDKTIQQNPKLPESYTPLFTPFSLIEYIGLTVKIDPIPADISLSDKIKNAKGEKKYDLIKKYWEQIYQKNLSIIDNDEQFTLKHIKTQQKEKISRIHPDIDKEKIKPFIHYGKMNDNKVKDIKESIALDQLYNHNYKKTIKHDIYPYFIREMIGFNILNNQISTQKTISFPFSRIMSKLWNHMIYSNKNDDFVKNNKEKLDKITKNIFYKGNRDLMDTELVHLSVVGQPDDDNKKEPVYCYTCDDYEQTEDRVSIYKGLIAHFLNDCKEKFQDPEYDINNNLIMGIIAFCNPNTGQIKRILDVEKVTGIIEKLNIWQLKFNKLKDEK